MILPDSERTRQGAFQARTGPFYRTKTRLGSATPQVDLNNWIFAAAGDIISDRDRRRAGQTTKIQQDNEHNSSKT
ncbi:MAG: hypothetical protein KDA70_21665, partial [Planctomycetaceae bacterium]|nr:hypothetical protein [Planctomycetaceae bacterium]